MRKKSQIKRHNPIVPTYVEWYDPTSMDGWMEIKDIRATMPHTIRTIGYMTHETPQAIVMSLNVDMHEDNGGSASCSMIIPKKLISFIQALKVTQRCIPKLPKK